MQVTRFIYADNAKGVKCLLFSPQYIEHKISTFNEIFNRMKEQKNIFERLAEVMRPFKSSLNSMFLPIFSLPGAFVPKFKIEVQVVVKMISGLPSSEDSSLSFSSS